MNRPYTESAFETTIAAHLSTHGYIEGSPEDFDQDTCLFHNDLFAFIQETQPELWKTLAKQHGDVDGQSTDRATQASPLRQGIVDALVKAMESRGTLDVLRHGIKFYGKPIKPRSTLPRGCDRPEDRSRS